MKNYFQLIPLFILLSFLSCVKDDSNDDPDIPLNNNGVFINHLSEGKGKPTLLFVHGWCGSLRFWPNQIEAFKANYNVVAIDLPGYGKSGSNRDEWTIEEHAQDINAVIEQLKLKKVVVIGHSFGGLIGLEVALINKRIIALVGIDNFKDVGLVITEEVEAQMNEIIEWIESDFYGNSGLMLDGGFHPKTDESKRQIVQNELKVADSTAAVADYRGILLNYLPKLSEQLPKLNKKLYLINSFDNEYPSVTDTVALNQTGISYELYNITGAGHFGMIEQPGAFNRILTTILDDIEKKMNRIVIGGYFKKVASF